MSNKIKTTPTNGEATPAVPKLRFPEFRATEGWKETAGEALFDQINDRNPEPGLPVLAITQEYGAIPRHLIDYHVSVTEKSVENYKVIREGDFIISLRSFQGGIEYSRYHGICSPAYVILRRKGDGSDEYFRHYLKTERFIRILTKNLEGLRDGKMISYAQFSELQVPLPSPTEQAKIAECLNSVDELLAAQARKVDALKTQKKGLMQQLFPCEGETQPRLRFPEFRNAEEWEKEPLQKLTPRGRKYGIVDGPFGSNLKTIHYRKEGIPIVTSGYVTEGFFCARRYDYVSKEKFEEEKRSAVSGGDIVMAKIGARCGASAILPNDHAIGILSGNALKITVDKSRYSPDFVWQQLWFLHLTKGLDGLKKVGAQPAISISNLKEFELPIPKDQDEQQRIADCLSSLDVLITAETQKLEALKTHKKGLMQQLFPSPEAVEA